MEVCTETTDSKGFAHESWIVAVIIVHKVSSISISDLDRAYTSQPFTAVSGSAPSIHGLMTILSRDCPLPSVQAMDQAAKMSAFATQLGAGLAAVAPAPEKLD